MTIFAIIASLLISNHPKNLQGMINNVKLTFSVGDTTQFTISIGKTIRIGDTRYHI